MIGLIMGFITYLGWGSGDIFGAYASRKIGAYQTTVFVFIFGALIASLYIPFALEDFSKITPILLTINIVAGMAVLIGNFLLNEGFKRSNASLVGIIVQSFPAAVLLLSALIFKDKVTPKQILYTIIIFSGVIISSINFRDFKNSKIFTDIGIKLTLIGTFIFTFYFTFFRIFSDTYGWFWANYIGFLSFPLAILVVRKLFKIKEKIGLPKQKKVLIATFFSALFLRGADIAFNYGLAEGYASTVSPIAGASPTLFILLSSFVFKDPITKQQKIGIGICLLGVILLSFFSN